MPTLDQRKQPVHQVDPAGTVGPVIKGLTVNYHSTKPPAAAQLHNLHVCLEIARGMAGKAYEVTRRIAKEKTLHELESDILTYHFRLPVLAKEDSCALWQPYLKRIYHVYDEVINYFKKSITISDSVSAELNPNADAMLAKAEGYVPWKNNQAQEKKVVLFKGLYFSEQNQTWDQCTHTAYKFTFKQAGSIHIPFSALLQKPNVYVARTLLHEATHKACNTRDVYYAMDNGYKSMSALEALDNADSYAWTALCLYKDRLVKNSFNGNKLAKEGILTLDR
jgi:hypothetical protein